MKKKNSARPAVEDEGQELKLHMIISMLMREFRLEPGLLAGSPYSGLHANDIGLFEVLTELETWNVRGIARTVGAPIWTDIFGAGSP